MTRDGSCQRCQIRLHRHDERGELGYLRTLGQVMQRITATGARLHLLQHPAALLGERPLAVADELRHGLLEAEPVMPALGCGFMPWVLRPAGVSHPSRSPRHRQPSPRACAKKSGISAKKIWTRCFTPWPQG